MLFNGEWYLCSDGVRRPVIRSEVLAQDGTWTPTFFLVDTGADRTVLSGAVLAILGLPVIGFERLGGVGGIAHSVVVETQIRLTRENGGKVLFHGQFAAFSEVEALDMSVLGRDVTGLFAMIVDAPGDVVCLVGPGHGYSVQPA
ncbi:MAG TPA: hypothetical protein VK689_06765 [Armatimonadota bacterium]|nr:hypothetical protein [Armatimonadota bacterium]